MAKKIAMLICFFIALIPLYLLSVAMSGCPSCTIWNFVIVFAGGLFVLWCIFSAINWLTSDHKQKMGLFQKIRVFLGFALIFGIFVLPVGCSFIYKIMGGF